jgi:hypothetical protein
MKKILEQFLQQQNTTIRSSFIIDYKKWVIENYPNVDVNNAIQYFNDERLRVRKRDKEYERTRVKKTISFTNEEYAKIQEKMELVGVDFSTFAKSILLKKKVKLPIERELLYELNKIGNNLNQIAKGVNSKSIDARAIIPLLANIEKELNNVTSTNRK